MNLFRIFNTKSKAQKSPEDALHLVELNEQDRARCHQKIDIIFKKNPTKARRAHLMTDIVTDLAPWIWEDELDHVVMSMDYISTDKLSQMAQLVHNKETPCQQKELTTKTLLARGHLHAMKKQLIKLYITQPLFILTMVGALGSCYHGVAKHNKRQTFSSFTAMAGAYCLSEYYQRKHSQVFKNSAKFWDNLERDQEEFTRVGQETKKWFNPNNIKANEK